MPRAPFSEDAIPAFPDAPPVILITGAIDFFVEEAAGAAAAGFGGEGAEVLAFDDESPAEAVSDALLNRSLFSARRVVQYDISRLLGSESPGKLLDQAVEAWEKGTPAGRREAFRWARALLSALDLAAGSSAEEMAEAAARKLRRKPQEETLTAILRELPEEKSGPGAVRDAIRLLLDRGNDGVVALLTAVSPPAGVDLLVEISRKGLVLETVAEAGTDQALSRLARALAKQREVSLDPDAVARLLVQTDSHPELFTAELEKLLAWAGPGGRVRAVDVRENVEDESSEDLYALYDAIGRRAAGDALDRLERVFSGRPVRTGNYEVETKEYWPVRFFGMLADEVRRMLLIRAWQESAGSPEPPSSFDAFKARVLPRLAQPVSPFDRSPFQSRQGQITPFLWFKAASRAARYSSRELAGALARAADVDVKLKSSVEPLDVLSLYVAELIAGS